MSEKVRHGKQSPSASSTFPRGDFVKLCVAAGMASKMKARLCLAIASDDQREPEVTNCGQHSMPQRYAPRSKSSPMRVTDTSFRAAKLSTESMQTAPGVNSLLCTRRLCNYQQLLKPGGRSRWQL